MNLPPALRALKSRNFRLFFGGQLISLIGSWMQTIAETWLAYRLTGSSVLLGLVAFCAQIPVLILSPFGGIVADRLSRHRIVIVTQTISMVLALIFALLTLEHWIRPWQILVLATCTGCVAAFDIPARQSLITDMVGKRDFINAIALNSALYNSSRVIGPAIAGILLATIGEGWLFFANGISYIAVIAGLLAMNMEAAGLPASHSAIDAMRESLRFILRTSSVYSIIVLMGVLAVMGAPYVVLLPIFADRILHEGARGLGLLTTSAGAGAVAAALMLGTRLSFHGLEKWIGWATCGFGVAVAAFALSRVFSLSVVAMFLVGFLLIFVNGSCSTLVQAVTPDVLRGRVLSAYAMLAVGMAPAGSLLAGLSANTFGVRATVAASGVFSVLAGAVFILHLPTLRAEIRNSL